MSISCVEFTQSGKPPEMPHNRPISFSGADYLLPNKTAPGRLYDRNAVPHESPLSLTLRNGLQGSQPPSLPINRATRGKESTNSSQNEETCWNSTTSVWWKRSNWSQSLKSLTGLGVSRFHVPCPCSLLMFMVHLHCSSSLLMFTRQLHFLVSCSH